MIFSKKRYQQRRPRFRDTYERAVVVTKSADTAAIAVMNVRFKLVAQCREAFHRNEQAEETPHSHGGILARSCGGCYHTSHPLRQRGGRHVCATSNLNRGPHAATSHR